MAWDLVAYQCGPVELRVVCWSDRGWDAPSPVPCYGIVIGEDEALLHELLIMTHHLLA